MIDRWCRVNHTPPSHNTTTPSKTVPSLSPHASIYIFPFLARPTLKGRMTLAVADRAYRRTPLIGAALHSFTTRVFDLVLHAISRYRLLCWLICTVTAFC